MIKYFFQYFLQLGDKRMTYEIEKSDVFAIEDNGLDIVYPDGSVDFFANRVYVRVEKGLRTRVKREI